MRLLGDDLADVFTVKAHFGAWELRKLNVEVDSADVEEMCEICAQTARTSQTRGTEVA